MNIFLTNVVLSTFYSKCHRYNEILTQTTDVERQLIKKRLAIIDEQINKGETVVLWQGEGTSIEVIILYNCISIYLNNNTVLFGIWY